jgi:hypothetical protein
MSRTSGGENRPPKEKGGPRLGSVDKGWCCHEQGQRILLSTELRLFPACLGHDQPPGRLGASPGLFGSQLVTAGSVL